MEEYNSYDNDKKAWRISQLLAGYLRDELSPSEQADLQAWREETSRNESMFSELGEGKQLIQNLSQFQLYDTEASLKRIKTRLRQEPRLLGKVNKMLRGGYLKWMSAAIICMVIGAGIFLFVKLSHHEPNRPIQEYNATLITTDGKSIDLNSRQQQIVIANGDVRYNNGTKVTSLNSLEYESKTEFLQLSTSKGAHYKIILADGTKVSLNSISTIKFPTQFVGEMRIVELYGEAYFEVKHDEKHPFLVKCNGQSVRVLGTEFNVSAYSDDTEIKSTLIKGAVRVIQSGTGYSVQLKPGEQSVLNSKDKLLRKQVVSIKDEIAWLDRAITFNNKSFERIMREVSRCCDVTVVYEGDVPDIQLFGSVHCSQNMKPILEVLRASNINYSFSGNTLTIKDHN